MEGHVRPHAAGESVSENNTARVELTIRYGCYGEQSKTVIVPIGEQLREELMEPVELSDNAFSLLLASPGMFGGKGDAVTIRRKKFQMRRDIAQSIAQSLVPELIKAFGVNDEIDGYSKENDFKVRP